MVRRLTITEEARVYGWGMVRENQRGLLEESERHTRVPPAEKHGGVVRHSIMGLPLGAKENSQKRG